MPTTSNLGTPDSQLGNIILGNVAEPGSPSPIKSRIARVPRSNDGQVAITDLEATLDRQGRIRIKPKKFPVKIPMDDRLRRSLDTLSSMFNSLSDQGQLIQTGPSSYEIRTKATTATRAPGVNDDYADGYSEGALWVNTSTDDVHVCVDDTPGAAAWVQLGTATADITQAEILKIASLRG